MELSSGRCGINPLLGHPQIGGLSRAHLAYRWRTIPTQISIVCGLITVRKYVVFLLKLSHLPRLLNDSVIQKPPSATLIDLIVVSVWTLPLTSYRLSFAKIIISEIDFLDTASTPNVLTATQVSFAAAGKSVSIAVHTPLTG